MKTLIYLLLTIIKNKILSLKKKPGLLVLYIIIFVYTTLLLVFSSMNSNILAEDHTFSNVRLLYGIFAAILLIITYSNVFTGLSRGSTLFDMPDIGLLFPAPISSVKILFYGMIKGMGNAFLTSIFLIFQLTNIKMNFNISNGAIVSLFLIYVMSIFYNQLLSMSVYIFSNADSTRKNIVKVIMAIFILYLFVIIFYQYRLSGGEPLEAVNQTMDSKGFWFMPVIGWSVMLLSSIVEGNLLWSIIPILLFFVSGVGMVYIFTKVEGDYYEDVLVGTEFKHNVKERAKEGKTVNNKKAKVRKDDLALRGGIGATSLFFKDLRERQRLSRVPFVDSFTLIVAMATGIVIYFSKNDFSIYFVLGFLIYLQLFMATAGSLSQELRKPYIYLIPAKSLNKLVFASMSSIVKPAIDGIIIFTIASIVGKTSILLSFFLVLAYVASSAMFVSYTLLLQRIFGSQPNQIVKGIVGVFLYLLVLGPGIALTVITILALPSPLKFLGTLPFTLYSITFSVIIFAICGNLIDKSEMVT